MVAEKVRELEKENISLKAQLTELQGICGNRAEIPKNCEYCANFIQHYIRQGNEYYPTYAGVCAAGSRIRKRKTDDTCKAYAKKQYGKNCV